MTFRPSTLTTAALAALLLAAGAARADDDIDALTQPPGAANCAALKSGSYRLVRPTPHATLDVQSDTLAIDAVALTVTHGSGAFETWTANGPCAYLGDGGRTEVAVSPGGVLMMRWTSDGGASYRWGVAIPQRTLLPRSLAGDWVLIGMKANAAGTAFTAVAGSLTMDAAGHQSAVVLCQNDATWGLSGADCVPVAGTAPRFVLDRSGGFDLLDAGGAVVGRAFAYRPRGGTPVLLVVSPDGGVQFRVPRSATPLPAVGDAVTSWNHYANAQLLSTQTLAGGSTASVIQSVDPAAGSWVRLQRTVGQANEHPETILGNRPGTGYNFRPRQTSSTADGTVVNVSEWTALPLPGLGFGAFVLPAAKLFALAARQP